jgi:hypothetical protein
MDKNVQDIGCVIECISPVLRLRVVHAASFVRVLDEKFDDV